MNDIVLLNQRYALNFTTTIMAVNALPLANADTTFLVIPDTLKESQL